MAQRKDTTDFQGLLFQIMGTEDPMLNMLEWLCRQMMEAEVSVVCPQSLYQPVS